MYHSNRDGDRDIEEKLQIAALWNKLSNSY